MKRMLCFVISFFVLLTCNAWADDAAKGAQPPAVVNLPLDMIPAETQELVRRLLEANGTHESMARIFDNIIKSAPEGSRAELSGLLRSDVIIDKLIPIYAKYFTADELKELIVFYKSPVGQKNLALTPKLMTEVMAAASKYFEDNAKALQRQKNAVPAASPAGGKTPVK